MFRWLKKKRLKNTVNTLEPPKKEDVVTQITLYANNEMYFQELRISLSFHDWIQLQNQDFFQKTMKYLDNLQTRENSNGSRSQKMIKET